MQLKIEALEELRSEEEVGTRCLDKILSRYSSLDSLDRCDPHPDDLDKLSICLSEASTDSNENKRPSLCSELLQAQLALWTLIGSIFYSHAWQQHRKKFLFSLLVVVPPVIMVCITISSLLTAIVILSRIFSTPLRFEDILKFGRSDEPSSDERKNHRQWRALSIDSHHSSTSGHSMNDDFLPQPMCRKHSSSGVSNQQPINPSSLFGNIGSKPQPTHRLSYTFTHSNGEGENSFSL